MKSIMCLDPSLRNTGVAIIEVVGELMVPSKLIDYQTIKTKKPESKEEEVEVIGKAINTLLRINLDHNPVMVVGEMPTGAQGYKGAISVGVSWSMLGVLNAKVVTPNEVKNVIGAKNERSKKQKAIDFVSMHLHPKAYFWDVNEMNHVADAICSYFAYLARGSFYNSILSQCVK